jgi:hypothetical protein
VAILYDNIDLQVHAAFGVSPSVFPTSGQWVSIGADAESVTTVSNGRSDPWSGFTTGSATIVLDNQSLAYDNLNGSSLYATLLRQDTWIRVQVVVGAVTEIIFLGLADTWQTSYEGVSRATCTVTCNDVLARVGQSFVDMSAIAGKEMQTVQVLIYAMQQINGPRLISYVPTAQYYCRSMIAPQSGTFMSIAQACETVEQGRLFTLSPTAGYGALQLLTSTEIFTGTSWGSMTSLFLLGDGVGESAPEAPYNYSAGSQDVRTSIVCNGYRFAGLTPTTLPREQTIDAPWAHVEDPQSIAKWQADMWVNPRYRYDELTLQPRFLTTVTPITIAGLSSRLTQRIGVNKRLLNGNIIALDQMVEQVTHTFTAVDWTTRLVLSPLPTSAISPITAYGKLDSWALDSPTYLLSP